MKIFSTIRNFVMNPSRNKWVDILLYVVVIVGIYVVVLHWLHH